MASTKGNTLPPSMGNAKDSIKSTWYTGDTSTWSIHHWMIYYLNVYPVSENVPVPKHPKTDKVPHVSQKTQHTWVLFHSFLPLLIHQGLLSLPISIPGLSNNTVNYIIALVLYNAAFNWTIVREVKMLRKAGEMYGFLDGDVHERDGVPDSGVGKVAAALFKTTGSRLIMATYLTYNPKVSPFMAMSEPMWWVQLFLNIGLYGIVLDFWFYVYHRAMHEVDFLWKFHRTHHLTKHPNALLSAYADHEQEFFDMVVVPFMTYVSLRAMGLPLGFYDWWICHQYIAFTEVAGHSGLRIHVTPPSTLYWLLRMFDAEIALEDHDLHHRKGYRKSANYGKQTRVWDRLFGTCAERVECHSQNVDYVNQAYTPVF